MRSMTAYVLIGVLCMQTPTFVCASYRFEVVARSGDRVLYGTVVQNEATITSIGTGPSINDSGKVAFTAFLDCGPYQPENGVLLVKDGDALSRSYFVGGTFSIGHEVQINDNGQVVWYEKSNDGLFTHVNRLDSSVGGTVVGRGSMHLTSPQFFTVVTPWASLNNHAGVVFSGDLPSGGTVLAFEDDECGPGPDAISTQIAGSRELVPMISDDGKIVVRQGGKSDPKLFLYTDSTFNSALIIAGSREYSRIGAKPAISDDGRVVAFMGEHTTLGTGVFYAIVDPPNTSLSKFKLLNVPPGSDLDKRVGVNRVWRSGLDNYAIVFLANDLSGMRSLYVVDLNIADRDHPYMTDPIRLARRGDTIGNFVITVDDINIYDPVNSTGQIVFWIRTLAGTQAIIVRSTTCTQDLFKVAIACPAETEEDGQIVPGDEVEVNVTLSNDTDETVRIDAITLQSQLLQETYIIPVQRTVEPHGALLAVGRMKLMLVDERFTGEDGEMIIKDVIDSNLGFLSLDDTIEVLVEYSVEGTSGRHCSRESLTDEDGHVWDLIYPDFSYVTGEPPYENESEIDYYKKGDIGACNYSHPLVRKYALRAARGQNPSSPFPDAPSQVIGHVLCFTDDLLLELDGYPADIYNDVDILTSYDQGTLHDRKHPCIEHAYLFTSLIRTLGLYAREINVALDVLGPSEQEAATQVWHSRGSESPRWYYYDLFMNVFDPDQYLLRVQGYDAVYAFNSRQWKSRAWRLPIFPVPGWDRSQWKDLKNNSR